MALNKRKAVSAEFIKADNSKIIFNGQAYSQAECYDTNGTHLEGRLPSRFIPNSYLIDTIEGIKALRHEVAGIIIGGNAKNLDIVFTSKSPYDKYPYVIQTTHTIGLEHLISTDQMSRFSGIGGGIFIKDYETALKLGFHDNLASGTLSYKKDPAGTQLSDYQKFGYPTHIKYMSDKQKRIEYGADSSSFLRMEGKKYTFGVEIETVRGVVPSYVRDRYNMCAKYDGSLKLEDGVAHGAEYITGVLKGDAGLIHLHSMVSEIAKRCEINKQCSVHVHIGSVDFTQEFIVYMYKLGLLIEKEMYSIMPASRRKSDYCRKMDQIDMRFRSEWSHEVAIKKLFDTIHDIVNVVKREKSYMDSKKKDHPLGHCCGYKKETPRYWWLNFVPAMYNIRGDESFTIEFRMHSATLNYKKIENWILICMGIVNFVENHKRLIKDGVTLADVMQATYPKNHKGLIAYIAKRKQMFSGKSAAQELAEYTDNGNQKMSKKQLINDVYNSV